MTKSKYFEDGISVFCGDPFGSTKKAVEKVYCSTEIILQNGRTINYSFYDSSKESIEFLKKTLFTETGYQSTENVSCYSLLKDALNNCKQIKDYVIFVSFY